MPITETRRIFSLDEWLRYQIEVLRSENWDVTGAGTLAATAAIAPPEAVRNRTPASTEGVRNRTPDPEGEVAG